MAALPVLRAWLPKGQSTVLALPVVAAQGWKQRCALRSKGSSPMLALRGVLPNALAQCRQQRQAFCSISSTLRPPPPPPPPLPLQPLPPPPPPSWTTGDRFHQGHRKWSPAEGAVPSSFSCSSIACSSSSTTSRVIATASPAPEVEETEGDNTLVGFGKFATLTYRQLREEQPKYCAWVTRIAGHDEAGRRDEALHALAAYLAGGDLARPPPQPVPNVEESALTEDQRRAALRVLDGGHVFITGAAGTGKSVLLRYIIQRLSQDGTSPEQLAVTAPTGLAAANIGGVTTHSWAGVRLGVGSPRRLLEVVRRNPAALRRWREASALVIDEVSMLSPALFEALDYIGREVRNSQKPFGGLQLILSGDFLQLPPIVTGKSTNVESQQRQIFCFQSEAWQRCRLTESTILLDSMVRQAGDADFAEKLNEIRKGKLSPDVLRALQSCSSETKGPPPKDEILPTKLYCHNKDVDKENAARLSELPGEAVIFSAKNEYAAEHDMETQSAQASLLRTILNKRVPSTLQLKVHAQVILVKNMPHAGLVNGSRGIVVDFRKGFPVVRFDTGQTLLIRKDSFQVRGGGVTLSRKQVPLKLGWALTVHKAQGMTLSRAELRIDSAFEAGMSYVALSRLTGTDGLWISGKGIDSTKTWAHPAALQFYEDAAKSAACAASV
eukprot:TRINITY_DN2761_c0_g1_i1.p1 TRINITY_DN2761_c0_g1~~TRINITY_DN2761_c0_g1_i1.p1  ORF type:complete len:687 (+),score=96.16 TRINITY_DN2761_c0_g1_i1:62-2062(+)